MKKYLLGVAAVVFAVAFSAFNKPAGVKMADFYSFEYKAPGGSYSQANVTSLAPSSWGSAILVTQPNQFQRTCPQTNVEKACEIIVPESETIVDAGVRRLRLPAEGGNVTIVATESSAHPGTYMVDELSSIDVVGSQNKTF